MDRTNAPKILYKYMPAETALKVLQTQTIRFSDPKKFNDLYDSDVPIKLRVNRNLTSKDFIAMLEEFEKNPELKLYLPAGMTLEKTKGLVKQYRYSRNPVDHLNKILDNMRKNMRVLSLSSSRDNLLMWAHYSNNHKGIVIGFKRNSDLLKYATPVLYSKNIPVIDGKLLRDYKLSTKEALRELQVLFQTKSLDWEYEQEWRCALDVVKRYEYCLRENPNLKYQSSVLYKELFCQKEFVHIPFLPEDVQSIYLGANINIIDENIIINIIRENYPGVSIFKASRNENKFMLDFKHIFDC